LLIRRITGIKGRSTMNRTSVAKYKFNNGIRAFARWIIPYALSRVYGSRLRPILSYLFTDWKCNVDCHYCFQFNNNEEGMTLETATSSIDWLKTIGCRVLAIMGGEPLLRKDFILKVVEYGSRNGFFVYLPTNGYLLNVDFIDRLGQADVAAINLAVDCIEPKPGLPKALMLIEPQFRYLVKQQEKYGYILFFNINITNKNIKDVKILTEIAHDNMIGVDYHVNEPPHKFVDIDHYKHQEDALYIKPEQYDKVDELLDWIIMKNLKGYTMVNSIAHLKAMKKRVRSIPVKWDCRAGHNEILIKTDGTLSPCFDLITYNYDWGRIWNPKFDSKELEKIKAECNKYCLSTCVFNLGFYYQPAEVLKWMFKHVRIGGIR
jgi:MoaA/NifB/PqqE/SkfB family radical SAM enzyme